MNADIDSIVDSVRIVTPQEAARDSQELAMLKIMQGVARMSGAALHFVRFPNGVTAWIVGDPNDKVAWRELIAETYRAAIAGHIGPISTSGVPDGE